MWVPIVKVTICGEIFHAHCDIMSEFCLMPKNIYESLKLWELSDCVERITLTDNTTIFPVGLTKRVFTTFMGRSRRVCTDYLVIECAGTWHITLGRSLLKLMGAVIDVGKGTLKFTASPGCGHLYPKPDRKSVV